MLLMDLTNNTGGPVTIDALQIEWNTGIAVRILEVRLAAPIIGNANQTTSPSDFPSPNLFIGVQTLREVGAGTTETLTINFQAVPTGSVYTVGVHFDIGCQVSGSK
jgi:hypothetical protein